MGFVHEINIHTNMHTYIYKQTHNFIFLSFSSVHPSTHTNVFSFMTKRDKYKKSFHPLANYLCHS
uniref:Uncharacterized protein n=1 Tax=Octopus bimaculoides TaxID=37653 RepID=A0A0L8GL91_OCTBM